MTDGTESGGGPKKSHKAPIEAPWVESYPPWDGLSPAHPRVAQAAYAYLQNCDLKAAIEVMLGAGPYNSAQISRLRHSREFWAEVQAQIRQRRLGALAQAAADGKNQAAIRAASAAAEVEAAVTKWLTRIEEARAKRGEVAPPQVVEVEEW